MSIDTVAAPAGWPALFWDAFRQSRNAMVLLDDQRRHVEVNGAYLRLLEYPRRHLIGHPVYELVVDGPRATVRQWQAVLHQRQFHGVAHLMRADGKQVTVEYAGHPEIVTGRQLVLFVAMREFRGNRRRQTERSAPPSAAGLLTDREVEVIELLARGHSGPEIATELQLAHNTVRTHVHNSMTKLGTRSRAQLVAMSLAEGIVWAKAS